MINGGEIGGKKMSLALFGVARIKLW